MSDHVFVKTSAPDALIEDLSVMGLGGLKVADLVVRVESPLDEDPEDIAFELSWFADRLHASAWGIGPEDMQLTPEGDPVGAAS